MSLARAFTTRRANKHANDMGSAPHRSSSTRLGYSPSIRSKISAPMALTHTTNMLAYNAPDLYPQAGSSAESTSSTRSEDESDSATTAASSPPTSPDIANPKERTGSPDASHLSCDFTLPGQQQPQFSRDAPAIPKRAPSHTKKMSYESSTIQDSRLSNQSARSVSTKGSYTLSRSSSTSTTATSVTGGSLSHKPAVPSLPSAVSVPSPSSTRPSLGSRKATDRSESQHPFGQELAQVTELAEDFGVKEKITFAEQEGQDITSKGLYRFSAEEYVAEIQNLLSTFFSPEPMEEPEATWI